MKNLCVVMPSVKLAERLGIDVLIYEGWQGPTWTGKQIILEKYDDILLWHEIAHWFAATDDQRVLPDYGMGHNTNNFGKEVAFWMRGCKSKRDPDAKRWGDEKVNRQARYQEDVASGAILGYAVMYPNRKAHAFNMLRRFGVDKITQEDFEFGVAFLKKLGIEVTEEKYRELQVEFNAKP